MAESKLKRDGEKLKRASNKIPIKYLNQEGDEVILNNSFILINKKVYVMAGEGQYLGKGVDGKVKLVIDRDGKKYALKISHKPGNMTTRERDFKGSKGISKQR